MLGELRRRLNGAAAPVLDSVQPSFYQRCVQAYEARPQIAMTGFAFDFFSELFQISLSVVSAAPITREPPRMSYITEVIRPALVAGQRISPFRDPDVAVARERCAAIADHPGNPPGMNTIGMLLDRLSILSIKHWNLINRSGSPARAEALQATQVGELISALAQAFPGHSSMNNKMTIHSIDAEASTFATAYQGLITTNLMLWESQEVLYSRNIMELPCKELRAYIQFFSTQNLSRNVYIEAVDKHFWATVEALTAAGGDNN